MMHACNAIVGSSGGNASAGGMPVGRHMVFAASVGKAADDPDVDSRGYMEDVLNLSVDLDEEEEDEVGLFGKAVGSISCRVQLGWLLHIHASLGCCSYMPALVVAHTCQPCAVWIGGLDGCCTYMPALCSVDWRT